MSIPEDLPKGRAGQALAVGLVIALAVLVWLGAVAPLLAWYADRQETLRQQTARVASMERLVASLPGLRQETQRKASAAVPKTALLDGATDAVAAAALQSRLDELAGQAGLHIGSTEVLPAAPAGDWRAISVRVSVTAAYPQLVGLLQAIAEAATPMLVDDLQLRGGPRDVKPGFPVQANFSVTAYRAGKDQPS
jgi:general secretion pathway protein M